MKGSNFGTNLIEQYQRDKMYQKHQKILQNIQSNRKSHDVAHIQNLQKMKIAKTNIRTYKHNEHLENLQRENTKIIQKIIDISKQKEKVRVSSSLPKNSNLSPIGNQISSSISHLDLQTSIDNAQKVLVSQPSRSLTDDDKQKVVMGLNESNIEPSQNVNKSTIINDEKSRILNHYFSQYEVSKRREKEQLKLENEQIMVKLINIKPSIMIKNLEKDFAKHERIQDNMEKYNPQKRMGIKELLEQKENQYFEKSTNRNHSQNITQLPYINEKNHNNKTEISTQRSPSNEQIASLKRNLRSVSQQDNIKSTNLIIQQVDKQKEQTTQKETYSELSSIQHDSTIRDPKNPVKPISKTEGQSSNNNNKDKDDDENKYLDEEFEV